MMSRETSILLTVYGMLFFALFAMLRITQRHTETPESAAKVVAASQI